MDELDKLKNSWNKAGNTYPKFSERDIYAMLHKKSSSEVKWILIISLMEFAVWGILMGATTIAGTDYKQAPFLDIVDYLHYVVLVVFIIVFYINFRKISSERPVKELMKNIITVRRIVKVYVVYMVCMIAFGLICGLLMYDDNNPTNSNTPVLIVGFIFIPLLILLITFVYNLLYGRLLKKLNNNYIELKKIQNQ
jgi:cytochrome bd-type quinol oxidase subunit 2